MISALRSLVGGIRIPPQPSLLHPVTQGHVRSAQTSGGARGRPGRGARELRPALTSHLLVTLSRLRSRCDRAPSPTPSPPTAPGIPEAGTSPVPVCHRCLLRDSSSLGHDPLQKLRSPSSGSTCTGRRGPPAPQPSPPARLPLHLPRRSVPSSPTGFWPTPECENTGVAGCEHCSPQPIRSQQPASPGQRLPLRARGGGRGHSQRGAHWLGRWPRSMAARAVRVRREAWAAVLARCRLAAAASYPRLPRGSRDPFAELRERHARAGKPGLGEPSGPPEREHAPSGLLWVPPWSWWWPESWDLTQARGGVRGTGSFRGGASRGLQGRQTPSAPLWDISVRVKTLSVAEHGGL